MSVAINDVWGEVGTFISILALIVAIRALNSTDKALKATRHSLFVSIYSREIKEAQKCLTEFYYPLLHYLQICYDNFDLPDMTDFEREMRQYVFCHVNFSDQKIVRSL